MWGATLEASVKAVAGVGFLILLADPFVSTASKHLWQTAVPSDVQGRVFALTRMIASAALPYVPPLVRR